MIRIISLNINFNPVKRVVSVSQRRVCFHRLVLEWCDVQRVCECERRGLFWFRRVGGERTGCLLIFEDRVGVKLRVARRDKHGVRVHLAHTLTRTSESIRT